MRPRHCAGAALGALAGLAVAVPVAGAQDEGTPPGVMQRPAAIWAWTGAGAAFPANRPGAARGVGPSGFIALQLPEHRAVAVRIELGGDLQELGSADGASVHGDLQQMRLVGALRYSPVVVRGIAPYGLAGLGVTWQSERITLRDAFDPVPGAGFTQTTSWKARGALLGAGLATSSSATRAFAEVRWMQAAVPSRGTSDMSLIAGVGIPIAP